MHALGYPDAQIPYELMLPEVAQDVMYEFHEYQINNLTWNAGSSISFGSNITNQIYVLNLYECGRFETPGEARFNQNGLWIFEEIVS